MSMGSKFIRKLALVTISTCAISLPAAALAWGQFNNGILKGVFVLSVDGAFASAPPFGGDVLSLRASQLSRLEFDGAGLARGEGILTFHHPDIPFGVTSRIAFDGSYEVAANGGVVISLDEFPLDMNGEPASEKTNTIVLQCYVVRRFLLSHCVLHTLITYQQGPEPRSLPVTMSGSLRRQF